MRYAIVSDIHANLQGWNAVVADMADMQIDHIICLGDIVGYGPSPTEVLAAVRKLASATVIGNHDAAACGLMESSLFNDNAREAIEWTKDRLNDDELSYLKELPAHIRPQGTGFLAVHAEVPDPMAFGYVLTEDDALASFSACQDRFVFLGHSHHAGVFVQQPTGEVSKHDPEDFCADANNRYIINPGSVGDPRSTTIVSSYCVYDDATGDVYFRRIPFDTEAFRACIDASGMASRPFFIRYLDDVMAGIQDGQHAIPSVQETDGGPQLNLASPSIKAKKVDPMAKAGIAVLVVALVAGIWFFVQNSKSSDALTNDKTEASNENKDANDSRLKGAPAAVKALTEKLPVTARYIRISLPRRGVLSLAEVEVYSRGKNVALSGEASQSSTFNDSGTADKAIDGNISGVYNQQHMTHTKESDSNWWMLDLGKEYRVDQLIIWNRDEGNDEETRVRLRSRLDGYTLEMMGSDKRLVFLRKGNSGTKVRNIVK